MIIVSKPYINIILADYKTKIIFKCRPNHKKYFLTSKTKDFSLNEINTFKNEIIHFFNIDSMESIIYIYLEIDGKKMKSESDKQNFYKLILKDIGIKNEKKEINCIIVDNIELKILIRIYSKFGRKKSNTIYKKADEGFMTRGRGYSQPPIAVFGQSSSIKEKIKIFSGEFIKKQIIKAKVIPGKLKIPSLFQKSINSQSSKLIEKDNEVKSDLIENHINDNNNK